MTMKHDSRQKGEGRGVWGVQESGACLWKQEAYPEPTRDVDQLVNGRAGCRGLPAEGRVGAVRGNSLGVTAGHILKEGDGMPQSLKAAWRLNDSQQWPLMTLSTMYTDRTLINFGPRARSTWWCHACLDSESQVVQQDPALSDDAQGQRGNCDMVQALSHEPFQQSCRW